MRTYVRMTSKGSIAGQLQRALAAGDVLAVRSLAGELPEVPLTTAAEITLLLLEREPEAYAPAVRRLLARLADERVIALSGLVELAATSPSSRPIRRSRPDIGCCNWCGRHRATDRQ
jgi:hypothetical protein